MQMNFGKQSFKSMYRLKSKLALKSASMKCDQPVLLSYDDPNLCTIGSEETHSLHQSVFESLQQSGHDYTVGDTEIDLKDNHWSTELQNDVDLVLDSDLLWHPEKLFDDTHNYALSSELSGGDSPAFKLSVSTERKNENVRNRSDSKTCQDHRCYSSGNV